MMEEENKTSITVETTVNAPIEKVWIFWTEPEHITQWTNASEDWHAPRAENDVRVNGRFATRMEAKDGSMGFDFGGVYTDIRYNEFIAYTMDDDRTVSIHFIKEGNATRVLETFDPESENPVEMQQEGWQAILDNFKKYVESN